jgi:hypothetical protein
MLEVAIKRLYKQKLSSANRVYQRSVILVTGFRRCYGCFRGPDLYGGLKKGKGVAPRRPVVVWFQTPDFPFRVVPHIFQIHPAVNRGVDVR